MADRFIRVTDEYLSELEETAERFFHLVQELQRAVAVPVIAPRHPVPQRPDATGTSAGAHASEPTEAGVTSLPTPAKKYTIGRSGEWEYAEVVWREYDATEFNTSMAWKAIDPLVETDAKRPMDSLRVSLDRDPRFRRIEDGRDGAWWRRVDPDQADLLEEETPAPAATGTGVEVRQGGTP